MKKYTEEELKQKRREWSLNWYYKNREKAKEHSRRYYHEHKEERKEYHNDYTNNSQYGRAYTLRTAYNREDKKYNRGECTLTTQWIIDNIFTKQCVYCGESDWKKLGCNRLDNLSPHTPENVEPCCGECNRLIQIGNRDELGRFKH